MFIFGEFQKFPRQINANQRWLTIPKCFKIKSEQMMHNALRRVGARKRCNRNDLVFSLIWGGIMHSTRGAFWNLGETVVTGS